MQRALVYDACTVSFFLLMSKHDFYSYGLWCYCGCRCARLFRNVRGTCGEPYMQAATAAPVKIVNDAAKHLTTDMLRCIFIKSDVATDYGPR